MSYHAKLIKGGKIVIPAQPRRELGFHEGDAIVVERLGDSIVLKTQGQTLREIRAKVRDGLTRTVSVDSYLREKRIEADRE